MTATRIQLDVLTVYTLYTLSSSCHQEVGPISVPLKSGLVL